MSTETTPVAVDVAVIGAGAAGIYAAHKMNELGFEVVGFERGSGVGGAWYWNRYPGLYCDVESVDYSFSFSEEIQQEWTWTQKYSSQPEILRYFEFVADRLDVRRFFRFDTSVTDAVWNEESQRWRVSTDTGEVVDARYLIGATGPLSEAKIPEIEGADGFEGEILTTARWPHEGRDFAGKRVAVLGTGSSGIQVIPCVAEQADHLYVLHRTASFAVPAHNKNLEQPYVDGIKRDYAEYRRRARSTPLGVDTGRGDMKAGDLTPAERNWHYQEAYDYGSTMKFGSSFVDLIVDAEANRTAADFLSEKIRSRVIDPVVAEKLVPRGYPILTRRLCSENNYYEAFNRPNVTLVDLLEEQLVRITPTGFETTKGSYEVDTIIFATGFDAFTGALRAINIVGRDGVALKERWDESPATYLGLAVSGFPNFFSVVGPLGGAGVSNVILNIEQHVEWIGDFLEYLREQGATSFDPDPEAQRAWVERVAEVADSTLLREADSWYTGNNIPGKPRVVLYWAGGVGEYERIIREVAADGYRGFDFRLGAGARSGA
jgi:cyclohexanone monooxygenase